MGCGNAGVRTGFVAASQRRRHRGRCSVPDVPRDGGVARLYLWHSLEQRDRFTGPNREREFLDAFRLDCLPMGEEIAASEPGGPCAKCPMNDSWTDEVAVPGVVLIGDAAGYNDAIIGEGLSIALRDARTVAETITGNDDWSPETFDAYASERAERMRRLRICASLHTDFRCTFTAEGRAHRGRGPRQARRRTLFWRPPCSWPPSPGPRLRRPKRSSRPTSKGSVASPERPFTAERQAGQTHLTYPA